MIFRRLIFSAVTIGILSGIILSLVQQFSVVPIILAAEAFEIIETSENGDSAHSHSHSGHSHNTELWAPKDGIERNIYTLLSNILTGIGFALMMLGLMSLFGKANFKTGFIWGLAGYMTFFLAPSLGLHPEIPGMEVANLQGRQGWWIVAVSFTGIGLSLVAFGYIELKVAGILLLLIPHILGAPLPEIDGFLHPNPIAVSALEKLASSFFQATAIANGIFWLCIGVLSGFLTKKLSSLD